MDLTDQQKNILQILKRLRLTGSLGGMHTESITTHLKLRKQYEGEIFDDCAILATKGFIEHSGGGGPIFRITLSGINYLDPDSYESTILKLTKNNNKYVKITLVISSFVLCIGIIAFVMNLVD